MYLLFYDVETTGLPDWHQPSGAEQQPHMVQLAAALVDNETRNPIQSMNVIIRPDDWKIPDDTTRVHGINTELAVKTGVPESVALDMFLALWHASDCRVAHNEQFDARIIRIATKRYSPETTQDEWKAGNANKFCTMRDSTGILKLPKTNGKGGHKYPKLEEAYQFFTGTEMANCHTAQDDVQACSAVYWEIQKYQVRKELAS